MAPREIELVILPKFIDIVDMCCTCARAEYIVLGMSSYGVVYVCLIYIL